MSRSLRSFLPGGSSAASPPPALLQPRTMTEVIGWVASLVLVATIVSQIRRQWREGTSKGVSRWLFIGQVAASAGFTLYSVLVRNYVFIVTNALMLASAVVGLAIVQYHRRHNADEAE
jgi:uncharacterized protein with PQ loop repeat